MMIGFTGKLSGGKTATAVRFTYDKWLLGKKVLSNIRLFFPNNNKNVFFFSNEMFVDFLKKNFDNQEKLQDKFYNSVLLLDEIGFLISARKSNSALNEFITGFLMMAGKLNCDVVYTAQVQESQTDLRLREITNILGNCYRVASDGRPLIFEDRIYTGKIGIYVVLELDFDIKGKKIIEFIYDPEPFFSMYNTREITILDRAKYLSGGTKDLRR